MKILHIVPTFYPATYFGGPVFSVYGLCNSLAGIKGVELRVMTTDNAGPDLKRIKAKSMPVQFPSGYSIFYFKHICGVSVSLSMLLKMPFMIQWADVVHVTGVYSFPTIPALFFCRIFRKPLVWSPRGALQQWQGARNRLLKRIWEHVCNAIIQKNKTILHVTSEDEAYESVRKITQAGVEIIENGVDIPPDNSARTWMPNGKLRMLYIGRLHPKKGIENLLQAAALIKGKYSLTICGTGDKEYTLTLKKMAKNLEIDSQVIFKGQVDGDMKSKMFLNSDLCVAPSHTENFGMVVAEALAHGTPVIASTGTPWQGIVERQCGLWVKNDPESLAEAITDIRAKDLSQMGTLGRKWMEEDFSWKFAAERMFKLYQRLIYNNK